MHLLRSHSGKKWKLGTHFYLNIRAAEERKGVGTGKNKNRDTNTHKQSGYARM